MISFFSSLLTWLPPELQLVCSGIIAIFFLVFVLRVVRFILDLIPFL